MSTGRDPNEQGGEDLPSREQKRDMHLVAAPQPAVQPSSDCREVTLRPYQPGDLQQMTALDQMCFAEAFLFGETMMEVLAEAAHALTIIAEGTEGEMAGFAIVHRQQEENPNAAYLVTIDVRPDLQRCGIGSGLLRSVERVLAETAVGCLELHVYTGNLGAIRFYEARGYRRKGRIARFYGAANRDAFLYSKSLAGPVPVAARKKS